MYARSFYPFASHSLSSSGERPGARKIAQSESKSAYRINLASTWRNSVKVRCDQSSTMWPTTVCGAGQNGQHQRRRVSFFECTELQSGWTFLVLRSFNFKSPQKKPKEAVLYMKAQFVPSMLQPSCGDNLVGPAFMEIEPINLDLGNSIDPIELALFRKLVQRSLMIIHAALIQVLEM